MDANPIIVSAAAAGLFTWILTEYRAWRTRPRRPKRTKPRTWFGLVADASEAHPLEFSDYGRDTRDGGLGVAILLVILILATAVPIFGILAWSRGWIY
jgi:hypothetical protein